MNAERLLKHFDRISEAPEAVLRLRRFILDLAVSGKLVEQDPHDESASVLLERIEAERARLVKAAKAKPKAVALGDDEAPFAIPTSWKWVRIGEVSSLVTKGSTPTSYGHSYVASGINFIKVEAIKNGVVLPENVTSFITEQTHEFLKRSQLQTNDFLFSIAGSIGTSALVTEAIIPANTNQALAVIRGYDAVFTPSFFRYVTGSSSERAMAKARGGAMNNISLTDVRNFALPLPPLAEQHRIVAKVDELMALCDELETARAQRETRRDRLVASTLHGLNNGDATTGSDARPSFKESARFYFNHLPRLTTRPEHIKQLRQTVLNLAVRGKLVEQDPQDEPASALLKRIEAEKARLVKAGEIKTGMALAPIVAADFPFDLPGSWLWVRLGSIADWGSGSTPPRGNLEYYGGDITWLKSGELEDKISLCGSEETVTALAIKKGSFRKNQPGDVLIAMYGATIGKLAILGEPAVTNQAVCGCTPFEGTLNRYLFLYLLSRRVALHAQSEGGAQPNISKVKIVNSPFPLPPLAEQHRIVAKVDELMTLCDKLDTHIHDYASTRRRLLEAMVNRTLSAQQAGVNLGL